MLKNNNVVNFELSGMAIKIDGESWYEFCRIDKGDLRPDDVSLLNGLMYTYFRFRAYTVGDEVYILTALIDQQDLIEYQSFWGFMHNGVIMSIKNYELYISYIRIIISKFYDERRKDITPIMEALTKETERMNN